MFPSGEGFCPPITGEPKGVIAGYVTEAEGDRCVSRMCFQCEYDTTDCISVEHLFNETINEQN